MNRNPDNVSSGRAAQVVVAGIPLGPALAGALYLLLVASAALSLGARRFPGLLPEKLEIAAPTLFLVFLICFALYRLALVRARRYPAFKAFFQIGATVLFFTLLLPGAKNRYERPVDEVEMLLSDDNPHLRALAAEVVRHRPEGRKYVPLLVRALRDTEPRVRQEAHRSLVVLTGQDLGEPEDEEAVKAWEKRFQ